MSELFRPQVMFKAGHRLEGEVVAHLPLRTSIFAWTAVAALACGLAGSCMATYSRRVEVSGVVLPDKGLIEVRSPQAGILAQVAKTLGQQVHAGERLATIRLPNEITSGRVDELTLRQIEAEGGAQRALYRGQIAELAVNREDLASQEESAQAKVAQAAARIRFVEGNRSVAADALARSHLLLSKGFLTKTKLGQDEQAMAAADLSLSSARSDLLAAQAELRSVRGQMALLLSKREQVDAQAAISSATLNQREVTQQAAGQLVLNAPVDGLISSVPVSEGQSIDSDDVVAAVVPRGATLVAKLFVPSSASGFVRVGQEVRLRYDSFPYETYGTQQGTIVAVSTSAVSSATRALASDNKDPAFEVTVALAHPFVRAFGKTVPLMPGNKATAAIVIERQSLFRWLLQPLYAAGRL